MDFGHCERVGKGGSCEEHAVMGLITCRCTMVDTDLSTSLPDGSPDYKASSLDASPGRQASLVRQFKSAMCSARHDTGPLFPRLTVEQLDGQDFIWSLFLDIEPAMLLSVLWRSRHDVGANVVVHTSPIFMGKQDRMIRCQLVLVRAWS